MQNMWIVCKMCGLATLCYYFAFCMIKALKVEHSSLQVMYVVGCWWLLAAVFVWAARTPHLGVFEAGGTFQNTRRQYENSRSNYTCKNDSKPSVNKKSDVGKGPGVGPTHKNLRLTPTACFLLASLYCCTSGTLCAYYDVSLRQQQHRNVSAMCTTSVWCLSATRAPVA